MKKLLLAAIIAAAATTGVPSANAVCAHSHGSKGPHVHSGSCDGCGSEAAASTAADACLDVAVNDPTLDALVCSLSSVTTLVEC